MKNNTLLYGLFGVIMGGFLVWFIVINGSTGFMNGMMGPSQQANEVSPNNSTRMGNMDRKFIEQMIPHHEDAVTMAKLAFKKSQRTEIKELSSSIIKSQSEEIIKMRKWYKDWYGSDVPESSQGDSDMGMNGGMMKSSMDSSTLADPSDFDKEFLTQMTMHHKMAIMMVRMMLSNTNRPELKQLGQDIIIAQTKEINQMQSWYKQWYQK